MIPKLDAVNSTSSTSTNNECDLKGGGKFCNKTDHIAKAIFVGYKEKGIGSYAIEIDGQMIWHPNYHPVEGFSGCSNLMVISDGPFIAIQANNSSFYLEKTEDRFRSYSYKPQQLTLEEAKAKIPPELVYDRIAFNRHGIFVKGKSGINRFICRDSSSINYIKDFKDNSNVSTTQGNVSFRKSDDEFFINEEPTTRWPDPLQGS